MRRKLLIHYNYKGKNINELKAYASQIKWRLMKKACIYMNMFYSNNDTNMYLVDTTDLYTGSPTRTAVPLPLRFRQPFLWSVSSWAQRPTQISWRPLISLSLVLNSVWRWPWWESAECCIWSGPENRVSKKLLCRLTNDSTSTLRGETKGNGTVWEDKINFYTCG